MSDDLVTRARQVAAAAPPPFADDSTQWTEAAYYALRDLAAALEAARDAINDAPHELCCGHFRGEFICQCWKSRVLAALQQEMA